MAEIECEGRLMGPYQKQNLLLIPKGSRDIHPEVNLTCMEEEQIEVLVFYGAITGGLLLTLSSVITSV